MTTEQNRIKRLRQRIKTFPISPGLYLMKGPSDKVLYIGKAGNLRARAGSYFQPGADLAASRGPKIVEMAAKVETVDYLETASEVDAILQEARLIKDIHPPYNTHLVDDKTFPYLEITTRSDFPAVYITRKPKNKQSKLFGPFTEAKNLRAAVVVLQKIFKFRTCKLEIRSDDDKQKFFRPCLLYSIKQCTGPCGAKVEKQKYKKQIKDLQKFLVSKRSTVLKKLAKEMAAASEQQDYETAAICRDRIRLIERLDRRGAIDVNVQPEVFAVQPDKALARLAKIFETTEAIRIIEGIDIAHISGSETVGSVVKFIDGRPFKSGYRRFKIKSVKGIDDYGCIREVIMRRYKHALAGEELWPDLILIDGGIGQLKAAADMLKEMGSPPVALGSIAKRQEEIFVSGKSSSIKLPANSPAKQLLQYARDEAHRFAQHYHHILRSKKLIKKKGKI